MPLIDGIAALHPDMTAWRRHLHAHPETAFEEHDTAAFVAKRLEQFGVRVTSGLAGTGVVGTIANGDGPSIGLRADIDALPITEANSFAHRSTRPGRMHACGHDGHTAMLLGAARYLAATRRFRGTVQLIFQPAEENEGGARAMIEDGLFDRFPVSAVYGLHNWPGLAVGTMAARPGPVMAAFDIFEVVINGCGSHAAMPHLGIDPVLVASAIVGALQTIPSRGIHPVEAAVVSVTRMRAGDAWNVIPDHATLGGTTRALAPWVQESLEPAIRRIVAGVAAAYGATAEVRYERRYPPVVNDAAATQRAAAAAAAVVGSGHVEHDAAPSMGAEDFAFMLRERPGAYLWIGNGPAEGSCTLHNPRYDFNDEILPIGASYWATLVERELPVG
jgi:amidohydrolase